LRAALPLGVVIGHAILLTRGYRLSATKGQRWTESESTLKVLSQPELPSFRHREPGRAKARISVQLTHSLPGERPSHADQRHRRLHQACGQARCR
jgi:hypothetical protein